jgi:hypothetical protein
MKEKKISFILGIVILALIVLAVGYSFFKKPAQNINPSPTPTTSPPPPSPKTIEYKNTEYGFAFTLPKSWTDYTVIEDEWSGDSLSAQGVVKVGTVSGPLVSIRHPDWDYKSPRQDIPVMVFTIAQWNDMQADKFHVGAAPINPSEIGRNKKYVFAIPARYNYAYLTGYEEVDEIIKANMPLKTF